jgi:hypothetical protein
MESIKGAGVISVYNWTGIYWNGYEYAYWYYQQVGSYNTGTGGPSGSIFYGGPNAGTYLSYP